MVPFTSFWENEALPDGSRPPVWFAFDETRPLAFFAGMEKVRFRKPVVPGDSVVTEVTVLWNRGPYGCVKAVARVADSIVAEGELKYSLLQRPQAEESAGDQRGWGAV